MSRYVVFALALISQFATAQTRIQGVIELDSSWSRTLYASEIASFHDMFKSSNDLIVAQTEVDENGNWVLELPILEEAQIIRLHAHKKADPAASLMIGGRDENFAFIAVDGMTINYLKQEGMGLFSNFTTIDHQLNREMLYVHALSQKWERFFDAARGRAEKLSIRQAGARELLTYADTSQTLLSALYAAHLADVGTNREEVYGVMSDLRKRVGEHSYFEVYPLIQDQREGVRFLYMVLGLMLMILVIWKGYGMYSDHTKNRLIQSLSIRERKVLELVKLGKSNKEIAMDLNIEVSTVKSHVNNIFSKLEIGSRNEVQRF